MGFRSVFHMIKTELLKNLYLFKNFNPEDLEKLKSISERKCFEASQTVFRECEQADSMFVVELGSVRIIRNAEDMVVFGRGETFGEVAFLDGGVRQGTAVTLEKTHLIEIPYNALRELLKDNPSMAVEFYAAAARLTSKKLRFYIDRLTHVQEMVHAPHHRRNLDVGGQKKTMRLS